MCSRPFVWDGRQDAAPTEGRINAARGHGGPGAANDGNGDGSWGTETAVGRGRRRAVVGAMFHRPHINPSPAWRRH
jgi:hypothetical protein